MTAPRAKWQKTIGYIRLVLHPYGVISLAALVALIVIEFKSPTAREFFTSYPETIGLIATLLNLIFTLSVVNRIAQRRDELRWKDIKDTTLKGLNDEVRSTRDILWVALFGKPPFGVGKLTEAAFDTARQSSVQWPPEPVGDVGDQVVNALTAMESDLLWTRTAAKILRLATEQIREGLVKWAPMMALAHGDYEVLVPVTVLADVIEALEYPFDDRRTDHGKKCIDAQFREPLRGLWLHAITTCVYAEENIVRTLYPRREHPERGDKPWKSDQPRESMLSENQRTEIDRWQGPPLSFWLRHPGQSWQGVPLTSWLGHPLKFWLRHPREFWREHTRTFENDTRDRKYEVTKHLVGSW
jgi:hypothetical protein